MKIVTLTDCKQIKASDLIRTIVQRTDAQSGISIDQMRKRMRILDALDGSKGTMSLEDADYELLLDLLRRFPFGVADKEIVTIADAIENAESGDLTKKPVNAA